MANVDSMSFDFLLNQIISFLLEACNLK